MSMMWDPLPDLLENICTCIDHLCPENNTGKRTQTTNNIIIPPKAKQNKTNNNSN